MFASWGGSSPQMVDLGVDFRPGRPLRHSSPQAASEILLMIVAFLSSPSAKCLRTQLHARTPPRLLAQRFKQFGSLPKMGHMERFGPSVALIGRRHHMRAMAALAA
jgi:hypothetical protein